MQLDGEVAVITGRNRRDRLRHRIGLAKSPFHEVGPLGITVNAVCPGLVDTPPTRDQHAQSLEAWFMHTPGIKVVMPATPSDAKGLLASCIAADDPCLIIEHMKLIHTGKEEVPIGDFRTPPGQAVVRTRGDDVTLIIYGPTVQPALDAAAQLRARGVGVVGLDLRTQPLDRATEFASVERTRHAVVVHESTQFCGRGAEIGRQIHEQLFGELLTPVLRVGAEYTPVPFAAALANQPDMSRVVAVVDQLLGN